MSWRQPAAARSITAMVTRAPRDRKLSTTEDTEDTEGKPGTSTGFFLCVLRVLCGGEPEARRGEFVSVRNGRHLARAERLQVAARLLDVKLRVARFDAQEEPVAAGQREPRHVEHGV